MRLRASIFVVVFPLLCASPALSSFLFTQESAPSSETQNKKPDSEQSQPAAQEQPPQPDQNSQQDQTKAPQQTTPAPAQAAPPSTQNDQAQPQAAPAEKPVGTAGPAGPLPKPPVLRHRNHTAAKKTGGSSTKNSAAANSETKSETPKSETQPGKVVVRNGGAKDASTQIAPATSPGQAQHDRATTAQLLALTDANLKRVAARQLTSAEQGTLGQIRAYVRQAKAASAAGDTNRAQILAYKARLLSDELARK